MTDLMPYAVVLVTALFSTGFYLAIKEPKRNKWLLGEQADGTESLLARIGSVPDIRSFQRPAMMAAQQEPQHIVDLGSTTRFRKLVEVRMARINHQRQRLRLRTLALAGCCD